MFGSVLGVAKGAVDRALGAVFQSSCLVCGRPSEGRPLCDACRAWPFVDPPLCDRCGLGVPSPVSECGECREIRPALARARSLLWYGEQTRELLHRVKFGARFELLSLFRETVRRRFDGTFAAGAVVLAVPLAPARIAARGFNQAEPLARWVAETAALPRACSGALARVRDTEAQSTLSRRERRKNLARSFSWRGRAPPPSRVLLVDDVYTTGTTLEACARALRKAGAREVLAWTLFRTVPPAAGVAPPTAVDIVTDVAVPLLTPASTSPAPG